MPASISHSKDKAPLTPLYFPRHINFIRRKQRQVRQNKIWQVGALFTLGHFRIFPKQLSLYHRNVWDVECKCNVPNVRRGLFFFFMLNRDEPTPPPPFF